MSKVLPINAWSLSAFKLNLKLAVSRLQLKRNKLFENIRQQRDIIGNLLLEGKDKVARAKTISLVKDEYMTEVLSMISLYCETLTARCAVIESSRTCPPDLQTPVCSILFAAHPINVAEVINVRKLLLLKFGKQIVCHCADLKCAHPKILDNLSAKPPPTKIINYYLSTLAEKHGAFFEPPPVEEEPTPVRIQKGKISSPQVNIRPVTTVSSETMNETTMKYNPTVLGSSSSPQTNTNELETRFTNLLNSSDLLSFPSPAEYSQGSTNIQTPTKTLIDSLPPPNFAELERESEISFANISSASCAQQGTLEHSQTPKKDEIRSEEINVQNRTSYGGIDLTKSEEIESKNVVIAIGSGNMRIGFYGEPCPRFTVPNIVGRPKGERVLQSNDKLDEEWIGDDAIDMKGVLTLSSPMENGRIRDWEDLVQVWRYAFSLLNVEPSECSFLLCVPEYINEEDRKQIYHIFSSSFNASSISIIEEPIGIASICRKSTALVIDCGTSGARIVPVVNMRVLLDSTTRFMFGGYQADSFFARLLQENGYTFSTSSEIQIIKEIKEEYCYVSQDYNTEIQNTNSVAVDYLLPDGQSISLSTELFQCMEPFFNPKLLGIDEKGIHHQVLLTLMKCPANIRRTLLENIILVGGTSKAKGFLERFGRELTNITPKGTVLKILAAPNREELSWISAQCFPIG